MTTYQRLQKLLRDDYELNVAQQGPRTVLADLGVDSLDLIELLCRIEDEFHIVVPTEQIRPATVEDLVTLVDRLVAETAGTAAGAQAGEVALVERAGSTAMTEAALSPAS